MSEIDYPKLSRQQKLALFLIAIGPEAAAELLKQFEDAEVEILCREMSSFTVVPASTQRLVIEELAELLAQSSTSVMGGLAYARRALELAKGMDSASLMGRVGPANDSSEIFKEISEMEGRQIFNLLKGEQPQTISFVLSYLESAKASEVFTLLSPELRQVVMERLGTIESTSLAYADKVVRSLGRHSGGKARPSLHQSGGVQAVASLLNRLDKETGKTLLSKIEESNAVLGAAVRRKMFSFDDLIRLQTSDLQRIMREVDTADLSFAMKAAAEPLREKIYGSLSKRAAEGLREEIQLLGPVKLKEVEAAQDRIIQSVRRLEESGEISIESDSSQALVA